MLKITVGKFLGFAILLTITFLASSQVITQHNDNTRTGWNNREKILHTKNVKTGSFGLIYTRTVDDQIYAQPLVVRVNMPNVGNRNIVYVATVNNTIYAFDADSINQVNPYWQVNLNPVGWRSMKNTDTACGLSGYNDFSGNLGLVGTPVIDSTSNTIYVVTKSVSGSGGSASFQQWLHALDLTTGKEKANSPVVISAQLNGTGNGSSGGILKFEPQLQNQRAGLLLLNGVVYIAWAAHGDCGNYHGWIMGYDKTTLAQKYVYNTTPNGYQGGIWMSGAGLSADELGNIYAAVGNGSVGTTGNPADPIHRSESALKLTPSGNTLSVADFFTPFNFPALEAADLDFGVTGVLLIPGRNQLFSGAKDGSIYLMNQNSMGGFNGSSNNVVQTFNHNNTNAHNLTSLTYFKGATNEFVYTWSDNVPLKALPYNSSTLKFDLNKIVTSNLAGPVGYNGAFLSVSSNSGIDSTAILWVSHAANSCNANQQTCPGILRAINANDITKELWNSSQSTIDNSGNYAKFNCPTISNGKVYLATFSNKLAIYGLTKGLVTGLSPDKKVKINIFPNPTKDIIRIECDEMVIVQITIYDFSGKAVLHSEYLKSGDEISLTTLSNGLYMVEVSTPNGRVIQKLLVNK